jgi:hypothetical protein
MTWSLAQYWTAQSIASEKQRSEYSMRCRLLQINWPMLVKIPYFYTTEDAGRGLAEDGKAVVKMCVMI